jgi:hypothetical protein
MMRALVVVLACSVPGVALADELQAVENRWQLDVQWWNDLFVDPPPADDQGFTNDFLFAFAWKQGDTTARASVFHRMITERYGVRRWDLLELTGSAVRSWQWQRLSVEATGRAGLSLAGNFGGLAIQNTWHSVTGSGVTVDEGLQDTYDGGRRAALLLGARGIGAASFSHGRAYAGLDGGFNLGSTGVDSASAVTGVVVHWPMWSFSGSLQVELAGSRYATADPNLMLRSGYGTDAWQLETRVSLGVNLGRYAFGWKYRSNEGGSSEPVGVLWLSVVR